MVLSVCLVCGEHVPEEAKSCPVCGTSIDRPTTSSPPPPAQPTGAANVEEELLLESLADQSNGRHCLACGAKYGDDYKDDFCVCGSELAAGGATPEIKTPHTSGDVAAPPISLQDMLHHPPKGTYFLTLYSEEKKPMAYFPIKGDITLIGRSDPLRGDFPDIDVSDFFDNSVSKKVSRKHLLLLRTRDTQTYLLRALAKNTGTQIESFLAEELIDYPITPGTRIVLGGTVRLKLECEA